MSALDPPRPLAPEGEVPLGRTRFVLDAVSAAAEDAGCSVTSTITASVSPDLVGERLMPHLSRVSRVEVTRSGRCRVLRVAELEGGSVIVTNGLDHSQAIGSGDRERDAGSRVTRLARGLLRELVTSATTDATNAEVAELTALLLGLDDAVLTTVSSRPLLHGAPFLSAAARPELVREGPIDPRVPDLLRDLTVGAPLEWALRRVYGDLA